MRDFKGSVVDSFSMDDFLVLLVAIVPEPDGCYETPPYRIFIYHNKKKIYQSREVSDYSALFSLSRSLIRIVCHIPFDKLPLHVNDDPMISKLVRKRLEGI